MYVYEIIVWLLYGTPSSTVCSNLYAGLCAIYLDLTRLFGLNRNVWSSLDDSSTYICPQFCLHIWYHYCPWYNLCWSESRVKPSDKYLNKTEPDKHNGICCLFFSLKIFVYAGQLNWVSDIKWKDINTTLSTV